jgi:BMFP domain-containing protein YqiC|tara:strand:+ start:299 stop:538 length:240 start_codon:yes stop_codon:yes gene_type:complete
MLEKNKIQEISDKIRQVVENSPINDIEKNINALLQSAFTKMGLVNREEFDIQTQVLKRTRLKLEALEKKLSDLNSKPSK